MLTMQSLSAVRFSWNWVLAYIDPGTGSYLFQLLIAGLVGAAFVIRTYRRKMSDFFSSLFSLKRKSSNEGAAGPDEPSPPESGENNTK